MSPAHPENWPVLTLQGTIDEQLMRDVRALVAAAEESDGNPPLSEQTLVTLRAAGGGRLKLGRKTEDFKATEVLDDARATVLRAYLKKWKWEVGAFFDGVGPDSTDAQLLAVAPDHPVFKIDA